jgi:hypothetical protein
MGWWIALGVVILLAVLPLGVCVKYNSQGPMVRVILGPVKFTVFPRPKKKKKDNNSKKQSQTEQPPAQTAPTEPAPQNPVPPPKPKEKKPKEEKGGSLLDFLPLVKLVFRFLGDFRRKLRVNTLELKLIMAGGDPCNLAVNYGRAWAAVGNLMPHLDRLFVIKKRDVEVECDFTASKTTVIARLDITLTLGRLLALVVVIAIRALKIFLQIKKKRKGGAANEQQAS